MIFLGIPVLHVDTVRENATIIKIRFALISYCTVQRIQLQDEDDSSEPTLLSWRKCVRVKVTIHLLCLV